MFVSSVNRLLGAVLVFTLLGCVPATQTGTSYSRGEARTVQQVQIGKVIEVTEITIEGTKSGAGGLVGGAVGGIAGGSTGSGAGGLAIEFRMEQSRCSMFCGASKMTFDTIDCTQ